MYENENENENYGTSNETVNSAPTGTPYFNTLQSSMSSHTTNDTTGQQTTASQGYGAVQQTAGTPSYGGSTIQTQQTSGTQSYGGSTIQTQQMTGAQSYGGSTTQTQQTAGAQSYGGSATQTQQMAGGQSYGSSAARQTSGTTQQAAGTQSYNTARHTTRQARGTASGERKKGHTFQKLLLSLSMGLLFGIFAGVGFLGVTQATAALQKSTPVAAEMTEPVGIAEVIQPEPGTALEESAAVGQEDAKVIYTTAQTDVSSIVKEVMPAMVSIENNYTQVTTFWGQTYREDLTSSGSGIIVAQNDEELLIVTNQHVVADADKLEVILNDDSKVEAKIKGTDKEMDLAVIAINVNDLTPETKAAISVASLGDSDQLELGEQVIAIGNALGYGQSVTVGYVSALDRKIDLEDGSQRSFIQTDAAINPGNSGGALLNAAGEVIGINSNKIGGSSIEGMGYAIPITAASPIIADLMERQTRNKVENGEVGYMGITYQDVTDQIAQMYDMPKGVYVVAVQEGSGAEAAGIMKGDVITKFDGDRISSFEDLQSVLQYFTAGDTVKVTIQRPYNGEYVERELEITLGRRPAGSRS